MYKKNPEASEMVIASTLTTKLGDNSLAKMIIQAKKATSTQSSRSWAAKLEEAQLKNWLSKKTSEEYVFRALKLDDEGHNLLSNPLLITWINYVKRTDADPYVLLLAKMRAQNLDDHKIASLLAAAKRGLPGSTVAEKVEELLLSSWTTEKKSADDVFKLLQLKNEGETLFKDPSFSRWVSYVRSIDEKNADTHMYTILRTAYGDDELAPMLVGAKKSGMGDVAKRVEAVQEEVWFAEGKTASEAFNALKLNTQSEKLFEAPAFRTWYNFMLNEAKADELMFAVLKTNYEEDVLAKMLIAAKKSPSTKPIAEKFEQAQMKDWITTEKSADDVFKLLKLGDDMEDLFSKPLLTNWVARVQKLKEDPYSILLTKLKTSTLTDTDNKLADMLMLYKKKEISSVIAGKIEAIQLEKWLSDGKTAVDVFKLLKIEKAVENAVWNPRTRMWVDYVTELDSKNADDAIFTVLKSYYSDEKIGEMIQFGWYSNADIAERLANTAITKWRQDGKTADNVFDFLLKDHHRYIFETRDIHTWVSYVAKLDKESPYKTMFEVLHKRFDEKQLGDMLYKAEKVGGTRDIAVKLELELWLSQKKSATGVFTHLNLASAENELFTRSSLPVWISYVTKLAKMDEEMAYEEMLSVLTTIFSNKKLERMLTVPKVVDGSEKLAAKLKALLFNLAKS